jgi:hypothetical protein
MHLIVIGLKLFNFTVHIVFIDFNMRILHVIVVRCIHSTPGAEAGVEFNN